MEAHDGSSPVISEPVRGLGTLWHFFFIFCPLSFFLSFSLTSWHQTAHTSPTLSPPLLPLSLCPLHHGISTAGDLLLSEPGRSHGLRGLLPADSVRGFDSVQRGSQLRLCHFTDFAQTQRLQKTGAVPPDQACVLSTDSLHHQSVWHPGMCR